MKKKILILASLGALANLPTLLLAQDATSDTETTTTSNMAPTAPMEPAQETTVTTSKPVTAIGTVTMQRDGTLVVRTSAEAPVTHYYYSKSTRYVDADGNTVASSTVKTGTPVSIIYTRVGDRLMASKVVVKRVHTESTSDGAVEQKRVIIDDDAAPAVEPVPIIKKKTTTTTTTDSDK
jgi:hypothetical protein